jgi:hypothetical protein
MAILAGIVTPLCKVLIKYLTSRSQTSEDDNVALLPSAFVQKLPFALRPLIPHPPHRETLANRESTKRTESNAYEASSASFSMSSSFRLTSPLDPRLFSSPLRQMKQQVFDKNRFVARIASFLALLTSFGIFFPPLLVALAVAICVMTLYEQWSIGDILWRSHELGYSWYLQKLSIDLEDLVTAFLSAIFPVALVSASLYAWLLLDTFGDKFGLHQPITILAPVIVGVVPLIVHFMMTKYKKRYLANLPATERPASESSIEERPESFVEMTAPFGATPSVTIVEKPNIVRPISANKSVSAQEP